MLVMSPNPLKFSWPKTRNREKCGTGHTLHPMTESVASPWKSRSTRRSWPSGTSGCQSVASSATTPRSQRRSFYQQLGKAETRHAVSQHGQQTTCSTCRRNCGWRWLHWNELSKVWSRSRAPQPKDTEIQAVGAHDDLAQWRICDRPCRERMHSEMVRRTMCGESMGKPPPPLPDKDLTTTSVSSAKTR